MLCYKRGDNMYRMQEMAGRWSDIRVELVSHYTVMIQHLAKIYYYRDFSDYIRGWKLTCRKGFDGIPKIKSTNKLPTFEKLYECMWEERADIFDKVHKNALAEIEYECDELPTINRMDSNFENFAEEYIRTICEYGSEFGEITPKENSDLIDELLDKYPYKRK